MDEPKFNKNHKPKEFYKEWNKLLSDIDVEEVPIEFIEKIELDLDNGQTIYYNINQLLETHNSEFIEKKLERIAKKLNPDQIRMYVNIDKLANIVQNATDNILKDL